MVVVLVAGGDGAALPGGAGAGLFVGIVDLLPVHGGGVGLNPAVIGGVGGLVGTDGVVGGDVGGFVWGAERCCARIMKGLGDFERRRGE